MGKSMLLVRISAQACLTYLYADLFRRQQAVLAQHTGQGVLHGTARERTVGHLPCQPVIHAPINFVIFQPVP